MTVEDRQRTKGKSHNDGPWGLEDLAIETVLGQGRKLAVT